MSALVGQNVLPASPRPRRGEPATPANLRLGEILVATGQVSASQLAEALERTRHTGRRIGEELVAAGHLPGNRLAPALKLQRRLVIAAFVAALFPMGRDADAAQARAFMTVSATIVDSVSIRSVYQAANVVVTAQDIARGYVDVPAGSRFEIRNKGPCLFEFRAAGDIFSSVRVTGRDTVVEFGARGGSLLQKPAGDGTVDVSYRFALAQGLSPGAYNWPLSLTVLPM